MSFLIALFRCGSYILVPKTAGFGISLINILPREESALESPRPGVWVGFFVIFGGNVNRHMYAFIR